MNIALRFKKLLPNGECETHFLNRIKAKAKQSSQAIDPIRKINLNSPVLSTRQTFMCDVQPDQCRWPVDEFDGQTVCCGMPVVDRMAREGRREATHCQGHLRLSSGSSLGVASLPAKGLDGRSAFKEAAKERDRASVTFSGTEPLARENS